MTEGHLSQAVLGVTVGLLLASALMASIRIVRGPTAADRVVALDMLSILGTAAAGIAALVSGVVAFVDVALAVALVGFLTTVAFAGFIERGSIDEEGE